MSTFGESGPYKDLYNHFKITDENLIDKIIKNLKLRIKYEKLQLMGLEELENLFLELF